MRKFSSLGLIFLIISCGSVPLEPARVKLSLDVPLVTVNLGGGAQIFLRVLDARPYKVADAQQNYGTSAPILPIGNLDQTLQDLFAERLTALGFKLLIADDKFPTRMDIAIQKLEYGTYSTMTESVHIDVLAAVEIYKNNLRVTEKAYSRIYEQESPAMGTSASWLEDRSNTVLSQLIEKILADLELLAALK